jgi:CIC family chloride channel protein
VFKSWLVVDSSGVVGVINRLRLERELAQDAYQPLGTIASSLDFPHVHSDQSFDLALERMGANQLDVLPVVNRANVHKLEGIVTLRDVLDSYGVSPSDRA